MMKTIYLCAFMLCLTVFSAKAQTWDVTFTAPQNVQIGYCNYNFEVVYSYGGMEDIYASNGKATITGLTTNPTSHTWTVLYSPGSCSFPSHPGTGPTAKTQSFSFNPSSGSGTQYVTLSYIGGITMTVRYTYHP